ncbi:hypothetical protein UlMin_035615 [Ulmus minor]
MAPPSAPHVLMFPFMAQGHTLPLLDLSKVLASKNIKVTILTTPSNAKSILDKVAVFNNIHLVEIPFPAIDGLPEGCENTSQLPSLDFHFPFLLATKKLQTPFEKVLQNMKYSQNLPSFVISDFFLGFTLYSCRAFGVPRLVFHGMSALTMAIIKSSLVHNPHLKSKSDSDPLDLPGLKLPFVVTTPDLPIEVVEFSDLHSPMTQFLSEVGEADLNSWGVVVNSFAEIEMGQVSSFEAFYTKGCLAWCVGPLNLYNKGLDLDSSLHTKWLNEQEKNSVLYVSFGSQADLSEAQLDEVAFGLEDSEQSFIWVVRSKTWSPPNGMKERIKNRGLIISEWVDQRHILSQNAIGGFLSHCGWNSCLESLSSGVPILAWPLFAEQSLNAKVIVEGLESGLRISRKAGFGLESGVVSRQMICRGARELMKGEKGKQVRERAEALGVAAKQAVEEGGSSHRTLDEMLEKLLHVEIVLKKNDKSTSF